MSTETPKGERAARVRAAVHDTIDRCCTAVNGRCPYDDEEVDRVARAVLAAIDAHADADVEWGVRFPSGAVESFGASESEARRFAITTTNLRPDLPTLVMRQVVTPWQPATTPTPATSATDTTGAGA